MQLSTSEIKTLETISNPASVDSVPRGHLERLSRLDLIEPSQDGVSLSSKGKQVLSNK
jgi:hypothetical protein